VAKKKYSVLTPFNSVVDSDFIFIFFGHPGEIGSATVE
jgi:hypothetical protein